MKSFSKLLPLLEIFLCFFIFFFALSHVDSPLDWDESDIGSKLANKEYLKATDSQEEFRRGEITLNVLNPFGAVRNHTVAHFLSLLSVSRFSPPELALRYPSLLLTALLLVFFVGFGRSLFPISTRVWLLAHLAVNQLALWYFHSSRGYCSMMLGTTAVLFLFLKIRRSSNLSFSYLFSFAIVVAITIFTHTFAAIFIALLFISLLATLFFEQKASKSEKRLLFVLASSIPVILALGYFHLKFINRLGFVNSPKPAAVSESFYSVFGNYHPGWAIAFLAFVGFLCWARGKQKDKFWSDPFTLLSLLSLGSTLIILFILKLKFFESRFLLGYLIPFTLWMLESSREIESKNLRSMSYVGLSLFLLILPWLGQKEVSTKLTQQLGPYYKFIRQVQKITEYEPNRCYSFSGEHDQGYFSQSLYLRNWAVSLNNPPTNCRNHFHLHFAYSWQGKHELEPINPRQYEKLFEDDGRILYRITTPSTFITQIPTTF